LKAGVKKTIEVDLPVWQRLMELLGELRAKRRSFTLSDVINYLLNHYYSTKPPKWQTRGWRNDRWDKDHWRG